MSHTSTNKTNLFLWILIAFLIFSIFTTIGIFVWLGMRQPRIVVQREETSARQTRSLVPPVSGSVPTPFADVAESSVPGRYRITDGPKIMYVFLNDDHTFINEDGTTYPTYNWEVSPNRVVITWQRGTSTFTELEARGIYLGHKANGGVQRMEKLPDLPPADTMFIGDKDAVASLTFTPVLQGTNLLLANLEGDGALVPGEAGGQECYHMRRQRARMSAFLYARIAPELKPFTNALVMVEYFDSPARDPRNGWISLQYDGRDGVYTSTAQRVKLNGTMKWTHATFVIDAPLFNGAENDQADFRICVANPDLSVRSIKVAKNTSVQQALNASAARAKE